MAAVEALEVRGVPPDVPDELLVLYFENRRRSGGGPVQSCRRRGSCATITFEDPEDAQRALARGSHTLQDTRLAVQPAAPRDYGKVVLQGLKPQSSRDLVELYVERLLKCDRAEYTLYRGGAGDQALVQLQQPLSPAEFLALAEQVQSRGLDGARLALDWVPQTDSLLVQSGGGRSLSPDVLELYFESKRSGGGPVRAVRPLRGGRGAVVSFQDSAVVERVLLQKTHQLQDSCLDLSPHYDFLEPREEEEEGEREQEVAAAAEAVPPPLCVPLPEAAVRRLLESDRALQELRVSLPECTLQLAGDGLHVLGGDPAGRQQLREHVQAALRGVGLERLPLAPGALGFLRRADVQRRLAELLAAQGLAACYLPGEGEALVAALSPPAARQAASLLGAALCPISVPLSEQQLLALASPAWGQLQAGLSCCLVCLAESGQRLEGLTLRGLEQESLARLEAFLRDAAPDESLVPMEPAVLRYLQLYQQELLASISDVTLLPLEGPDVTGLRVSGAAQACQVAAELLRSLAGALHTQVVPLQLPGVCRFLLDERGQAILRDLERLFRCTLGLEGVRWTPLEAQHELEMSQEPLALSCQRDSPRRWEQPRPSLASAANMEEIKGLLAALQPSGVAAPGPAAAAAAEPWVMGNNEEEEEEEEEEDLYRAPEGEAEATPSPASEGEAGAGLSDSEPIEEGPLPGLESGARQQEEEEAQLLLAIQQSMDSARREEEELQRATELSLQSYQRERQQTPSPDSALLSALSVSLEDALRVADVAQLVVCTGSEEEAAPLARELEAALRAQLREETVRNEALPSLPAFSRGYLAHLEQKHAVRISLAGSVATVCGFADYPVAATRDLALLLTRLLRGAEGARGSGDAVWVRWEPVGQGSPTPYSAQASALLEQAWRQGHRRVDVFFDGRPFTIDFERMEEYDLGNARTLPIGRTEPSATPLASPDPTALAEDEVSLVPLAEGTEEFRETVRRFYDTLEECHSKIRIIKVEKLVHPLLYQQYLLKKSAMEKSCGHLDVERVLYHGTTEQSSHEICQFGFNRSFCGKNATRYGHGVYFAAKAFISVHDQYSPPCGADGNKYIFVTRTLTGDYVAGRQDLRAPPLREGDATLRRYDSVVDNRLNPSIFVIFNDTQAYPQHLITCRWSKPH
ncbi:protein mono-ADP-ribosyltransferase PARP10 [Hemicordylus capensis]|uniref:protein mono-ADP-ribosyltransferase PARP10 n=1 Tax=Hemicordylus capensis TaxID=884348 RepID=UPI0023027825|nr:protein mono-ADP-ribosyltransferase PARP10 [Hemicordylus capensis]